jgi:hypothetical protein
LPDHRGSNVNNSLQGSIILFFTGGTDNIVSHLRAALLRLGDLEHVSIRVNLNEQGHPKVYEWDPENGPGAIINVKQIVNITDKQLVREHQMAHNLLPVKQEKMVNMNGKFKNSLNLQLNNFSDITGGVMVSLFVDILPCLDEQKKDSNITCPAAVEDVMISLMKSDAQKVR